MIGERVKKVRNQKNISLRNLAKQTGLSHSFICDIEHDRCNPSIEKLKVLAKSLGVEAEFFLRDKVVDDDHDLNPTGTDGQ